MFPFFLEKETHERVEYQSVIVLVSFVSFFLSRKKNKMKNKKNKIYIYIRQDRKKVNKKGNFLA